MTIESLRDILKEENSNSAINGSLAAVFSSVHKIDNRATLDPKLGAIPTLRIADEEEIIEKVNTLAELVGEEKFYLKVGGLLYQRGADVGLKPDGLVTKSESEKIEAERILNANIPETHSHKRKVINPTVGELVACMGQIDEFKQIRAQFITERLAEGATMEEADAEAREIEKEARLIKEELKAARRESQEKIEKILPQKKVSEDEINNLYAAIYDEETSPQQIVVFIDEIKQAALRIEKIVEGQKAKITKGMKFSEKVNKFLSDWVDYQVYQADFEVRYERENPSLPFLPSIFDAAAKYHEGALSGSEAAIEGLKNVAADAVVVALTAGICKGGSGIVKKAINFAKKGVVSSRVSISQVKKLGLNVIEEPFKLKWKNPDITARGLIYEDLVMPELEKSGATRLAPNTNTFDAFNRRTGHAISVKSLDTQTRARLIDPRQMEHLLNRYVNKMQNFKGIKETKNQLFKITPDMVKSSEIRVGVPRETTMEQWQALQRSVVKAEQQGVKITFGVEK